jgi:DNA-binding CsgD family transcriptional regulator
MARTNPLEFLDAVNKFYIGYVRINLSANWTLVPLGVVHECVGSTDPKDLAECVNELTHRLNRKDIKSYSLTNPDPRIDRLAHAALKSSTVFMVPLPMRYITLQYPQKAATSRVCASQRDRDNLLISEIPKLEALMANQASMISRWDNTVIHAATPALLYFLESAKAFVTGLNQDYNFDVIQRRWLKSREITAMEAVHIAVCVSIFDIYVGAVDAILPVVQNCKSDEHALVFALQTFFKDIAPAIHIHTMHEITTAFGLDDAPFARAEAAAWVNSTMINRKNAKDMIGRLISEKPSSLHYEPKPTTDAVRLEVYSRAFAKFADPMSVEDLQNLPAKIFTELYKESSTEIEKDVHRAKDRARKSGGTAKGLAPVDIDTLSTDHVLAGTPNVAAEAEAKDEANRIKNEATTILTKTELEIFTLHMVNEYTPLETAKKLGKEIGVVTKHITNIRRKFKYRADEYAQGTSRRIMSRTR